MAKALLVRGFEILYKLAFRRSYHSCQAGCCLAPQVLALRAAKTLGVETVAIVQMKQMLQRPLQLLKGGRSRNALQPVGKRLAGLPRGSLLRQTSFELIKLRIETRPNHRLVIRCRLALPAPLTSENDLIEKQGQNGDQRPQNVLPQAGLTP